METIKKKLQSIPDRKRYIDFIAALFALPVMFTVLLINLGNLQNDKEASAQNEKNTETVVVREVPQNPVLQESSNSQENTEPCKKRVGPIEIASPQEGQVVTSNPVNILIRYDDTEYCSVVWSYRINGKQWSEYSNNSISLYNPPDGKIVLDLRVQSTASKDQTELQRVFEYMGQTITATAPASIVE